MRTRREFLEACEPTEAEIFEQIISGVEDLARKMGDSSPYDEAGLGREMGHDPLRLRFTFNHTVGWSLKLRHPKLKNEASLLWGFPTHGVGRDELPDSLSVPRRDLLDAGIRDADIERYCSDLADASFKQRGKGSWRTSTAGESKGMSRIFSHKFHADALITAISNLINRISKYND